MYTPKKSPIQVTAKSALVSDCEGTVILLNVSKNRNEHLETQYFFPLVIFTGWLHTKHEGRRWPSSWKKLLSGQRPGTGDCITPSFKEGKSCICLSQNKTIISSSGTREEAAHRAAPVGSQQPGTLLSSTLNTVSMHLRESG